MLSDIKSAFSEVLDAETSWLYRWPNEKWPSGTTTSEGNMPISSDGSPLPAIEVEIIGGTDTLYSIGASSDGKRVFIFDGLFRAYISVELFGSDDLITVSDALVDALSRKSLIGYPGDDEHLVTADPRIDDGVAAYEEGNRYCRMMSVPFEYFHRR